MNEVIVGVQSKQQVKGDEIMSECKHNTYISASLPYVLTKQVLLLRKGDDIGSIWI